MTPLMQRLKRAALPRTAHVGDLAAVNSIESFILARGHQLRGANCVLCRNVIGGYRVAVIGLAGLAGDACRCGAICGDLFLIHAHHFPANPDDIEDALRTAMVCDTAHPAHR